MFGFFTTYRIGEVASNIIVGLILLFALIGLISTIAFFIRIGINAKTKSRKNSNRYM